MGASLVVLGAALHCSVRGCGRAKGGGGSLASLLFAFRFLRVAKCPSSQPSPAQPSQAKRRPLLLDPTPSPQQQTDASATVPLKWGHPGGVSASCTRAHPLAKGACFLASTHRATSSNHHHHHHQTAVSLPTTPARPLTSLPAPPPPPAPAPPPPRPAPRPATPRPAAGR